MHLRTCEESKRDENGRFELQKHGILQNHSSIGAVSELKGLFVLFFCLVDFAKL